jgi:tetratricopeptide (TPR) repeat protein
MAKKKNTSVSVSQEDNVQAQNILTHYQQVANNLHVSTNQEQAETALTEINSLPEGTQIALLKMLSKETHVDAADVLLAIHELSSLKSARKEARRSLIRLEGAKIYPAWEPPLNQISALSALQLTGNPPRFWKGIVTDSMHIGEVQLLLCWEQGDDYKDVRVLGFLLEFGRDGVKDVLNQYESKRSFEKFLTQMIASMDDIKTKNCTLAQGRRLLLDALAINKQYGTTPHKDYRLNLSLINQLILEVPDLDEDDELLFDEDSEDDEDIDLHDLKPGGVVSIFVESHIAGNFGTCYDLLTQDSTLREGLSKHEWIERRKAWEQTANPGAVEPNLIFEHEQPKSRLWLPSSRSASRKEATTTIEAGWSAELDETPLGDILPELPKATVVYEETRRHWFWASYSLVKENGEWRLQSISDEGLNAQNLSIEELQKRIDDIDDNMDKLVRGRNAEDVKQMKQEEITDYLAETVKYAMQSIYYSDVLIKKLPLDRTIYAEAAERTLLFYQYERSLAYLLPLAQRFPEQHSPLLRQIAAIYRQLSRNYANKDDDERAERFNELAEEALNESLTIENSFEAHISFAELLIEENERLDEARDHLLQAKEMASDADEEAHVEIHLGEIATEEDELQEALQHYQRVLELRPEDGESWSNVALAHENLDHIEEAITSYQRAIELEPDNSDAYYRLSRLYTENNQFEKAVKLLADGLVANPDSVDFNIMLASLYMEKDDYRHAEIFMKKAERLDPEADAVQILRPILEIKKSGQEVATNQPRKFLKQKKTR